ncbi:MAG: hypothetical protein K2Q06_08670, partial [Parvularculaceae bacterium]|nr:hypothetical protein [Parvularculaceae bacterium]
IPFVFNRFRLFGSLDRAVFRKETAADREALSRQMGGWWAAFARDGAPGDAGGKGPLWPQWSENGGTLMRLDSARGGGSAAFADKESMERILADMRKDSRLDDARRCAIARGAVEFNAEVSETLVAVLGC